ncbi:MAG: hypothetical protein AAF573_22325, partial [Bacteroidota bacterium]
MQVNQLLQANFSLLLSKEGREELQYLLAPILCKDAWQQEQFYKAYQEFLAKDLQYSEEAIAQLKREAALEKEALALEKQDRIVLDSKTFEKENPDLPVWGRWIPLVGLLTIAMLIAFA